MMLTAVILIVTGHDSRSRLEVGRTIIAILCCAGILLGEYRLLPQTLKAAIPAVLLTGAARAFWYMACRSSRDAPVTARQADGLLCFVGLLLTTACIVFRDVDDETVARFSSAFEYRYLPLLAVNLVATATALRVGKSFLVPIDHGKNEKSYNGYADNISDVFSLLAITGITGSVSAAKLRRSYTSWPQYTFFVFVIALLSSRDLAARHGRRWITMYDAVPDDVNVRSVDSEDTFASELSEGSDDTRVASVPKRRDYILLRTIFIVIALPGAWLAHFILNFSQHAHQKIVEPRPILDITYTPHTDIEAVINMYKEPIDQVAHLVSTLKNMSNIGGDAKIHIYIKDMDANVEEVQKGTGADQVTPLPNIGREGETYLKHILGSWDTLAAQTVFLQADVHNPRELFPRIRNYFVPGQTGMLSLGWSGQVCNCENCGDRFNLWDTTHLFPDISNRISNITTCNQVLLSYKGQFIASAKRIRGVDKSVYQDLHDAFVNRDSWAHQEEYLQGRPDSMDAPVFGYTMERMWNLLFQCNSMEIAWRCPSLLSGNRVGGNIEDCQCFDRES
ncbi:uncharacterized protein N0V89_009824 [Didymosphaeria variabile]|uniref:Uncharacterized protein n=1 Tax=Didymosphaeria variabile TaxID=1932322 RepID=A0A9W9C804_9PLEO|nr:uncharacterized protein N0V89_009824 [Didymosphaeria variabile]KAJ4348450.1 hypothetical protein N0V89_009824 [Didymosphaeria variabile]